MVVACIGLGANLGDAPATLRAAIQVLAGLPGTQLLASSRLYRSPAWGNEAQPDFVNAAVALQTELPAPQLLEQLLAIEQQFGRVRETGQHWGPRLLDLDLLLYAQQVIDLPQLKVPHPFLHQRGFALLPLADVAPQALIPGHGTVRDVLVGINTSGIDPIGG